MPTTHADNDKSDDNTADHSFDAVTDHRAAPADEPSTISVPYSVYTLRQKWFITFLVSCAGMISPLTSNIFFPVIPQIAQDLGTSILQINLSVTLYMILQGVSPSFFGACTDVIGRRPVYLVTLVIYIGASIGLANTEVYWLLLVLRCIQATGSASVISIGSGTIGDISPPSERGGFMALSNLGIMAGPAWAPVVGGLLAGRFGWQSIFYFLTALGGTMFVLMFVALPETLRAMVGNGSIPARGINVSVVSFLRARNMKSSEAAAVTTTMPEQKTWRDIDLLAPLRMFREKDILLTLTFNSSVYMLWYALTTSTSTSIKAQYGLSETQLGLCFIANGVGCIVASVMNGPRLDKDYKVVTQQVSRGEVPSVRANEKEQPKDHNDLAAFPIERARLRSLPPFFGVVVASHITYGWTVQKGVHLSVPLIMQFFAGLGVTTILNSVSTLLVDLYPKQAASATAANNLYRCLCGAAGTAIIEPLINAIGEGWALTLLSLLCCALTPLIILEWRFGMRFRAERAARVERRAIKGQTP